MVTKAEGRNEDKIFDLLFNKDEVTWQTIIYELVKTNEMDPWDIDVVSLSKRFLDTIFKLEQANFRISGKLVLAAALLLKIKSEKLMTEGFASFDELLYGTDDELLEGEDYFDENIERLKQFKGLPLMPKTPQPRKRKVSVYDLVKALERALEGEAKRQRVYLSQKKTYDVPKRKYDMNELILKTFERVKQAKLPSIAFADLVPDETKEAKIYTFVPLLHLDNQRKIDLMQKTHLGDIFVNIL
ncbi:MAG: segregation/condensation protein A [Candidatus Woesearchaeota archaeon]|nr:MAG: segregation/condensation protein A [Candidatus Woesearchaeota archaeon]